MMMTMTYTIKDLRYREDFAMYWGFICKVAEQTNEMYEQNYYWRNFQMAKYLKYGRLTICLRNSKPVGLMLARMSTSMFDASVKIYRQDLLYAEPGTRGAYYLMKDFIDFGRKNAKHIITMIAAETNIKPESLEKLGFEPMETLYRLEV